MSTLVNKKYKVRISKLENVIKELDDVVKTTGNQPLSETTSDLLKRIHDPFMFVVVGEVKAGKSSFINALLDTGTEICKAAPSPMTDVIQQIVYGEKSEEIDINEFLKKRTEPIDILKEVAIVDTPGTNTIVKNHQEITERFIPVSDLVVFVFEAKNPYRQSAWEFFDFIHGEWHKKTIFILQQKDLLSEADLQVNMDGLRKYATEKRVKEPVIFAVSAKAELEGNYDKSNFSTVRDYIKTHVTGGLGSKYKIINYVSASDKIIERIKEGVSARRTQWEQDKAFRRETIEIMENQYAKSVNQVGLLVENTVGIYEKITREAADELRTGLSLPSVFKRSFSSVFGKGEPLKKWLGGLAERMESDLSEQLRNKLDVHVGDISDSIQQMAQLIDIKVQRSDTSLKDDPDFFKSIAEKRVKVYQELKETFADFLARSDNFAGDKLFPYEKNIAPNVATGGGLAVIGVILTAFTQGAVLDITGGVLTAVGLTFAGATVGLQRKKIMKQFRKEILEGKTRLEIELTEKLETYIQNIKSKIDHNFLEFDELIASEEKEITALDTKLTKIEEKLKAF